ncbi:MAG: efflux RND transporter permease subunit, partial [Pseudomonadota bacterium]
RTGGRLVTREGILSLDVDGRQIDAEALADIPVGVDMAGVEGVEEGARRLRLGDIATIAMHGGEDQRSPLFERAPSMKIQVWPRSDVAPSEMRAATDRALDEAAAVLPAAIRAEVVWDSSDDLRARIGFLGLNAAVGLGLVLLLLTLFLDLRLAIWVAVGIPTAFLGAFLLLPATGATINLVSLFAFILALGLVVDDAIVAGENIYEYRARGYRAVEAAVAGARDIAVPLSFSVITNIIAFLPLAMVPGWYGRFWLWIPVVVTLAFIVSWIEALFVLPGHLAGVRDGAARSRPARALARVQGAVSGSLAWFIARIYGPALRVAMSWRYATIAGLVALLMIALAWPVSGRMGFQLMPPLPQPWINLRVSLPVDAPKDVAETVRARMLDAAYAVIEEHGRAGTAERVESEAGTGYARLHVRLPDEGVRVLTKGQWIAAFRRAMGPVPEATATNFGGEP